MKTKLILSVFFLSINYVSTSQIIYVPDDQPSIQAGINVANDGDTVLVAEGTWVENIRFKGKRICVASHFLIDGEESYIENTIIDGSSPSHPDSASVVLFTNLEDTTSVLCGFTIQGGTGLSSSEDGIKYGGGIACRESGAKIINNIIKNNTLSDPILNCGGGGIGNYSETGFFWIVIENNLISDNVCTASADYARGGGIYAMTNTIIRNNTIENNNVNNSGTQSDGAGIEVEQPLGTTITASIHNNIIQNNIAEGNSVLGGGIMIYQAPASISNNEILDNKIFAEEYAFGAGMYILQSVGEIYILSNVIENNESSGYLAYGGGFFILEPSELVLIQNNAIKNNSCSGEYGSSGGAVGINTPANKVHLTDNEISNNSAGGDEWSFGGVTIFGAEDFEVVVDRNIFRQNTAMHVGGFYAMNTYNLKICNNLFFNNDVDKHGGAIFLNQYYGKDIDENFGLKSKREQIRIPQKKLSGFHPIIINNTFIENHAGEMGGAIYTTSNYDSLCPVILNNIFWDNSAGTFGNDIRHGGDEPINVGYNNVDPAGIWGNVLEINNIFEDPLFIDPVNEDFNINKNSLCVASGIDSLELNGIMCYCPLIDLDNNARPMPIGAMPDMGAYEVDESIVATQEIYTNSPTLSLNIFPNPFSNTATIEFTLPKAGNVYLEISDNTGKIVMSQAASYMKKGKNKITFNSDGLPAGVYFLRLISNEKRASKKIILIR